MQPKIGIEGDERQKVAEALAHVLADTYALYQKTHFYHWNVRGPRFAALHTLFETQYNELWAALDVLAERIRALGLLVPTPGSLATMTSIGADNDPGPSEDAMLRTLAQDNEAVVRECRKAMDLADEVDDQASVDLLTQRLAAGEKAAWMLRAHLVE